MNVNLQLKSKKILKILKKYIKIYLPFFFRIQTSFEETTFKFDKSLFLF